MVKQSSSVGRIVHQREVRGTKVLGIKVLGIKVLGTKVLGTKVPGTKVLGTKVSSLNKNQRHNLVVLIQKTSLRTLKLQAASSHFRETSLRAAHACIAFN